MMLEIRYWCGWDMELTGNELEGTFQETGMHIISFGSWLHGLVQLLEVIKPNTKGVHFVLC